MPSGPLTKSKAATAPVTPKDIWDELEATGASSIQAAAIMGNWIAESKLDPESHVIDSNGQPSYGLAQWNAASYPDAHSLVTGHPTADLVAQVRFAAQTGAFKAASGSTVQQAAKNFAARYERCAQCQPGGAQNAYRQAQAALVAGWAQQGQWPSSVGSASDQATLTASQQAQGSAECAWMVGGTFPVIPFGIYSQTVSGCVLSKSQLRAIEGIALMGAGVVVMVVGIELLFRVPEKVAALGLAVIGVRFGRRRGGGQAEEETSSEQATSPSAA